MTNINLKIKNLIGNYEKFRIINPRRNNENILNLFNELKEAITNCVEPAFQKNLNIEWGMGAGNLPLKPVLYLLSKSANVRPSSGIYVALIIDSRPDENYGNYRLVLTQGYSGLAKERVKTKDESKSKAKEQIYEDLKSLAVMLADSYYAELKSYDFNVASTDYVSSDLIIAERIYNVNDNTNDDQFITDIKNLLRVYLNLASETPHTPGSDDQSIADAYRECLVLMRRGQAAFRKKLFVMHGTSCMVTGFNIPAVIEAAHIIPFSDSQDHDDNNGLLLRADLHKLYDSNLLNITPDGKVCIVPAVRDAGYSDLNGKKLTCKINVKMREYLTIRFNTYCHKNDIE